MSKKPDGQKKSKKNGESQKKDMKKQEPRYQKPQKAPKVSGARPASYEPNYGRLRERERQQFARNIAEARERFPMFCDGIPGSYLIGINTGTDSEGYTFEIRLHDLPATADKPAKQVLDIFGDDGIRMPHKWLFFPAEAAHYVPGTIGKIQRQMLMFLQDVLKDDIWEAKQRRWEAQRAAQESATEMAVQPSVAPVSSADVLPIQDAIWQRDCRPIADLVKSDCLGIYSAPDEKGQLILELRAGNSGNEFVVKKITPEHHLSAHLVYGAIIKVDFAARTDPQFDQHIRALLEISGIRLSAVKSCRDNRAHVTEGMPNVREETQLAA